MDAEEIIGIFLIFLILIFLFLDRKNIEIRNKIIFLRKTKKLNEVIEKFAYEHPKFLNILGTISIISVFVSFFIFIYSVFHQLAMPLRTAPLQIVLPSLPGICESSFILCVPSYFWLIVIPIIAFSHEIMHALISVSNKIKLKSIGYAFLLFLPAFFVEIDENKLKKADVRTKLKIYASGSFGNFLIAFLAYIILYLFSLFLNLNFGGINYEVIENSSAYYSNLTGIILKINNYEINNVNDLIKISKTFKPNETIIIETTEGVYNITLDKDGKIGIKIIDNAYYPKNHFAKKYLINFLSPILILREFFFWLFILSLGVGMFNLLPFKPLDGGLFFEELLKSKFKKNGEKIYYLLSFFTVFLIILLFLKFIIKF